MKKIIAISLGMLVLLVLTGFVTWSFLCSHRSIDTMLVDRDFSISAQEPPLNLSANGAAFAIVKGELNGTATIEVVGNEERDRTLFQVGPGTVEIAFGGAEEWIGDYHIRYKPITATSGHLYASVYCGERMSDSEWDLFWEISERERRRSEPNKESSTEKP